MEAITTIGLDIAKSVFQVYGIGGSRAMGDAQQFPNTLG